jgi:dihydrofolate reductase
MTPWRSLSRGITAQDTVLLGRRTNDEWAGFWPTSPIELCASFINGIQKFVATSTPVEQEWARTAVVQDELAGFVTELKQREGGYIGIHGSISGTQSLLSPAGYLLVDCQVSGVPVPQPNLGRRADG